MFIAFRSNVSIMSEITVTLSREDYERLEGLAAARGRDVDEQLSALVDDACAGDPPEPSELPLGVCDRTES